VFTSERRRVRAEEAANAAREADRLRIEEALAPYENAIAVTMLPGHYQADVIDVIDLRDAVSAPQPPALRTPRRRNRPLVYIATTG
jgi:hypothetical protein